MPKLPRSKSSATSPVASGTIPSRPAKPYPDRLKIMHLFPDRPLGTDDEAAGRPPSPFRIALARYQETVGRWMKGGRSTSDAHPGWDITLTGFFGLIAALRMVLLIGIWVGAR